MATALTHSSLPSLDLLCIVGLDGDFKELNPAWEAVLGWTLDELKTQSFLALVHPEDQAATRAETHKLTTGTATVSFENRYRCKNGTYKRLLWSAAPFRHEARFHAVARERSARQRAAEASRLLRDIAVAANEATEVDGALQYALDRLCAYTGWPVGHVYMRAEDGSGEQVPTAIWHLDDAERFHAFHAMTMVTRFAPQQGLVGRVLHAGKPAWINDVSQDLTFLRARAARASGLRAGLAFPVLSGTDVLAVLEFFATTPAEPDTRLLDLMAQVGTQLGRVVERSQAAKERERAAAELRRSNEELQQFAYVASHDLQEPLRMIVSYLQLLARRYTPHLDAEAQEYMAFAIDGAARMQGLITDLLAYSRIDMRKKSFVAVDCAAIVPRVLTILEASIREHGAQVSHDALPTVLGDERQLTQLFQNLLSNAIKFHGDAPPRVQISAARRARQWCFAVRDHGIGMEPQDTERIFAMFQRLHTKTDPSGTGIGLAICKRIVERHDGRIWVESAPGQGSTFYFTLPAVDELPEPRSNT